MSIPDDQLALTYKKTRDPRHFWELVERYSSYLMKFATFLKHGNSESINSGIRFLINSLTTPKTSFVEGSARLKSLIGDRYESVEELYNELCLIFHTVVLLYDSKPPITFAGYIKGAFPGSLKNWIVKILNHEHSILKTISIEEIDGFDIGEESLLEIEEEEKINLNDRHVQILTMKYVDELKIDEIAHVLEESPSEVRRILNEALCKFKKEHED